MRKTQVMRFIAGILASIMVVSTIPQLPVRAEESYTEMYAYDLAQIEEQVLNSEEAVSYTKGAVTFPGNGTAVNVGSELVYHLFRQGNTEKEQSVTLLTQDITAGYGDDYEILVDGEVVQGKANILLDGEDVIYDVYLDSSTSSLVEQGDNLSGDEPGASKNVDLEQVKEEASSSFSVTFMAGEQVKEIRVRAKVPEVALGNKEFQMIIYECSNELEKGAYITSVITLAETRKTPEAEVALVEGSQEVADGYVSVLVERTGNTNGYTSYDLSSVDGTAVNGEDYILSTAQLLFSPGVSFQRVHIPLVSADTEEDMVFTLRTEDSEAEISYRSTTVGAATGFKEERNLIHISLHDFVKSEKSDAVDSDGIVFNWEDDSERYKFGFRSSVGKGNTRNASIRTADSYDFTGIESVKFSASYGVGTVAGDHLDVYASTTDYALNEGMLGNLSGIGARYSVTNLTGQGLHTFSVDRTGEYYLYMTAEQHSGSGWIYYYLYEQEFDGGDEGHVALVKRDYTLETVSPKALGSGSPASDVKLTLSTDKTVTGEKVTGYRDESFQVSYKTLDDTAHYVGYQLVDSQYNVYHTEYTTSPVFVLSSDIIARYGDKFADDTIRIRPVFEHEQAEVKILEQDFSSMNADGLSVSISTDENSGTGTAVYKDNGTEVATVTWSTDYAMRTDLIFEIHENDNYTGEYHFTAFKVASRNHSAGALSNPVYHFAINDEWSLTLEDEYYEITPIISNRNARLLLNVTGADHGTFDGEPEGNTQSSYTVEDYDGQYNANDIVFFIAKPDDGYRAKWSYRDVSTGETKVYYGQFFYYQVQVPMLLTDNHVSLEFEACGEKKEYSVTASVLMQGGNLLHEPAEDSNVYAAYKGAKVSLEGTIKESQEDGKAGIFTIRALPGETYTALVMANNRQYVQDVAVPSEVVGSFEQTMKLSYYYEGPRVTALRYYAYDGTLQCGDTVYLSSQADSVIFSAEIEKAGQEVTDVIYKLKDSEGTLKNSEVVAEKNGAEYLWSAQLGLLAVEGDQIWIELVKREYNDAGQMISSVSYGEVNTGYTIVIAEYANVDYIPDTGVDQVIEDVPVFGSMYCMLRKAGVKAPTFSVSKSGGVVYLTIGFTAGGMYNFYHAEDVSGFAPQNTWTGYKGMVENGLKAMTGRWNGDSDKVATQSLKSKYIAVNFNISAQLALYDMINEETGNSELVCVGSWLSFGFSGSYTYNMPFFVWYIPMFACVTVAGDLSDTIQLTAKESSGYVALQEMHDPTKSSYKSDNDLKFVLSFAANLGVGINSVADVAGGVTGKLAFDWVDFSWGTIKLSATGDLKVELLIFGGTASINLGSRTILDTNPYTAEEVADAANVTAQESLLNRELSMFRMKSLEDYDQIVNATSNINLRTAGIGSDILVADAYDFSRPQMYAMGNNTYMIVATVDSAFTGDAGTEESAVLAYAIYNADSGTYVTDENGHIFQSLQPADEGNGRSINFHPSVTKIGNSGKYFITWNSILYTGSEEDLSLINSRPVIKAAVYDKESDSVVAYKSLVTAEDSDQMMASVVLDTVYDEVNQEVIVLYRVMNLNGMDENSRLIDYANAGSSLMCTSIKLDDNKETTFTESEEIATGGKTDGIYHIIKTADLAVMDDRVIVAYQMTAGEQANLISTGEDGSENHIYVASLTKGSFGYELEKQKEVTEGISEKYNAQPQLLNYTFGKAAQAKEQKNYNILMWKQDNRMATIDPLEFLDEENFMGTEPAEEVSGVEPTYSGTGTAAIMSKTAGSMGDYQIIQGADGKVYSIWTEGITSEKADGTTVSGSRVMMAALEEMSDGCEEETTVAWGTGSVVFETTDNKYVRAMSPTVDENGILHALYRETLIDGDSDGYNEIVMQNIDLKEQRLVVENYSQLSDEEIAANYDGLNNLKLYVSNLYPTAGETLTIKGRVKNEGVQASKAQELILCVNGSDTGERVEIPSLSSGISDEFTFAYTLPDTYTGEKLTFSVQGARGTMLTESTIEGPHLDVTYSNLEQLTYLDTNASEGTVGYNVTLNVTNDGNDVAEETTFVLSNLVYGKNAAGEEVVHETVFGTCEVPLLKPGKSEEITFQVDIPNSYFMENEFHLASIAGAIYSGYDPANVENQTMMAAFTDYVQAVEAPEVASISMAESKKIGVGQKLLLHSAVEPAVAQEHAELTYESSDTSVAMIDENGILVGVKEGTCIITVTAQNGVQKKVNIQVTKEAVPDEDEKYNPDDKNPDGSIKDNDGAAGQKDSSKTGDDSPIGVLLIVLAVSVAVSICIIAMKKKKK